MNYSNMTTAALQSSTASISLPPISSIDFHTHVAHGSESEVVQPLPPPPPGQQRVLPPLPYPYAGPQPSMVAPLMPHDYMQARPIYPGIISPYQQHMQGRMPLPLTTDPNLIVAPTRHKAKEVKRRTKTGCLTCRKRRIKVSSAVVLLSNANSSLVPHLRFSVSLSNRADLCQNRHRKSGSIGAHVWATRKILAMAMAMAMAMARLHGAPLEASGWVAPNTESRAAPAPKVAAFLGPGTSRSTQPSPTSIPNSTSLLSDSNAQRLSSSRECCLLQSHFENTAALSFASTCTLPDSSAGGIFAWLRFYNLAKHQALTST